MLTARSKDGTRIAYDRSGQGPALILVAGAFSYRQYPGTLQLANLLAQRFTVYNYDRRGRGDSEDTPPYAVDREIDDLQELVKAAGGSAYVWGLSSGATLALKAAGRGLNIVKLALQEPPMFVNASDRRPPEDFLDHITHLIESDRRDDAIKYFMTSGMGAPGFVIPLMHLIPGAWPKLRAVAHTLPYDAHLLEGYSAGQPLSAAEFSSVKMPTLVMAGTESPAFLRHGAEELSRVLPHARLLMKKGLGHTKSLSTRVIASVLVEFLMGSGPEVTAISSSVAEPRL